MYSELVRRLRELHPEEFGDKRDFAFACQQAMHEAADAIEELSKPQWIPVTERLPEEAGAYLVAVHQDDSENAEGYSLVLDAWYNPKTYPFTTVGWTLLNEWYDLSARLREEITHWMPLPEPPKEE